MGRLKYVTFWLTVLCFVHFLTACDRRLPVETSAEHSALAAEIKLADASATSESSIAIPSGADTWLIAAPYALEHKLADISLNLSTTDRDCLIEANRANENILLARVTNGGVAEFTILGTQYDASPAVFIVRSGDTLTLQRRGGSRPLVIVKHSP